MATSDDRDRVTNDAVNFIGEAVDHAALDDEATWRAVDEFRNGKDLLVAAEEAIRADHPIPRRALLVCLAWILHSASESGHLVDAFRLPEEPAPRFPDDDPGGVEAAMLSTLHGLATLELLADDADEDSCLDLLTSFVEFGKALADGERYGEATRAIMVAVNFDKLTDGLLAPVAVEAHRLGVGWATAAGDPEMVALHLAGIARGLAQQATSPDSAVTLTEAAEAWWFAIRHASAVQDHRGPFEAELTIAATALPSNTSVQGLLMLLSYDASRDPDVERGELAGRAARFMQLEWDLEPEELVSTMPAVGEVAMDLETMIIGLDQVSPGSQLETSWTTQMFEHPSYRRTVAHGRTLYREGKLDGILLELAHEITHVISQNSMVGAAIGSLRAVSLVLESTLWAHVDEAQHGQAEESPIAPLDDHNVLALAQAEQVLEVARKMQVLRQVWTPWFEGLAVFCELAVDPSEGDRASLVGHVLANMVDYRADGELTVDAAFEVLMEQRQRLEAMYADVLDKAGRARLRTYLDPAWSKYGAGYLAVRQVVAAWRKTMGRPVSGTEIAMVLLHLTRHGSLPAIPDLGLVTDEFEPAAIDRMAQWVAGLVDISAADLEFAVSTNEEFRWNGVPPAVARGEEQEVAYAEAKAAWDRLVDQAWNSLRGERATADRVPVRTEFTRRLMESVADALTLSKKKPDMTNAVLNRLVRRGLLLPLGQMNAPFWVNVPTRALIYVVRTTESDVDHGGPGYDLASLVLPEDSFADLREQMRLHPDRRMTITRLADLGSEILGTGRSPGQNILAFHLGEWLHAERRGGFVSMSVDHDLLDDIRARLLDDGSGNYEAAVADGVLGAERTIAWIDEATGWHVDGDVVPVAEWDTRVRSLALAVRDHVNDPALEARAAGAMLGALPGLSRSRVDELLADGLRSMVESGSDFGELVEVLFRSGLRPVVSQWLDALPPDESVLSLLESTPAGWDVRATPEEKP